MADTLANHAVHVGEPIWLPVPIAHVKQTIAQHTFAHWSLLWSQHHTDKSYMKRWFPQLQLLRKHIWSKFYWHTAVSNLILGRGPQKGHQWWKGATPDEILCHHCGEIESTEHYIFDCYAWEDYRRNWTVPSGHAKWAWARSNLPAIQHLAMESGYYDLYHHHWN